MGATKKPSFKGSCASKIFLLLVALVPTLVTLVWRTWGSHSQVPSWIRQGATREEDELQWFAHSDTLGMLVSDAQPHPKVSIQVPSSLSHTSPQSTTTDDDDDDDDNDSDEHIPTGAAEDYSDSPSQSVATPNKGTPPVQADGAVNAAAEGPIEHSWQQNQTLELVKGASTLAAMLSKTSQEAEDSDHKSLRRDQEAQDTERVSDEADGSLDDDSSGDPLPPEQAVTERAEGQADVLGSNSSSVGEAVRTVIDDDSSETGHTGAQAEARGAFGAVSDTTLAEVNGTASHGDAAALGSGDTDARNEASDDLADGNLQPEPSEIRNADTNGTSPTEPVSNHRKMELRPSKAVNRLLYDPHDFKKLSTKKESTHGRAARRATSSPKAESGKVLAADDTPNEKESNSLKNLTAEESLSESYNVNPDADSMPEPELAKAPADDKSTNGNAKKRTFNPATAAEAISFRTKGNPLPTKDLPFDINRDLDVIVDVSQFKPSHPLSRLEKQKLLQLAEEQADAMIRRFQAIASQYPAEYLEGMEWKARFCFYSGAQVMINAFTERHKLAEEPPTGSTLTNLAQMSKCPEGLLVEWWESETAYLQDKLKASTAAVTMMEAEAAKTLRDREGEKTIREFFTRRGEGVTRATLKQVLEELLLDTSGSMQQLQYRLYRHLYTEWLSTSQVSKQLSSPEKGNKGRLRQKEKDKTKRKGKDESDE
eukprot:scaffold200_cov401-Prasinococcus_capsulatus_cf.AAC.10